MTKYVASGKRGKRLWIRTKDKRWIEIPYGARQDANIRSVNVWDGSQWMTPTWGWYLWQHFGYSPSTHGKIDGYSVRAPDVKWVGSTSDNIVNHVYNPNYVTPTTAAMFVPEATGWTRLWHVSPRNDPNWLIVPIGVGLPRRIPNQAMDLYDYRDFRIFWPAIGKQTRTVYPDTPSANTSSGGNNSNGDTGFSILLRYEHSDWNHSLPSSPDGEGTYSMQQAASIDLKAIRARMADTFPEQNPFYQGQYKPIATMQLRRVLVRVRYKLEVTLLGSSPPEAYLDNVYFRVWRKGNAPTTTYLFNDNKWQDPLGRELQYPSSVDPQGAVQAEFSGSDLDTRTYNLNGRVNNRTAFSVTATSGRWESDAETWELTAPGDNVVCFYPEIGGLPLATDPNIDQIRVRMLVYVDRIVCHYATANNDVPSEFSSTNDVFP